MEHVEVRVVPPDTRRVRCAFCRREEFRVLSHLVVSDRYSTGLLGTGEAVHYTCSPECGAIIAQRIDETRLLPRGARPLQPFPRRASLTSR